MFASVRVRVREAFSIVAGRALKSTNHTLVAALSSKRNVFLVKNPKGRDSLIP